MQQAPTPIAGATSTTTATPSGVAVAVPPGASDIFAQIFAKLLGAAPVPTGTSLTDLTTEGTLNGLFASVEQLLTEGSQFDVTQSVDPTGFGDQVEQLLAGDPASNLEDLLATLSVIASNRPPTEDGFSDLAPQTPVLPAPTGPIVERPRKSRVGFEIPVPTENITLSVLRPSEPITKEPKAASKQGEEKQGDEQGAFLNPTQVGIPTLNQRVINEPKVPRFAAAEPEGRSFKATIPLSILPRETRLAQPVKVDFASLPTTSGVGESSLAATLAKENSAASTADRNAEVLARVDRQEFIDRIAQALQRAHEQAPKKITLDLTPPELGKVRIQVTQMRGELTARIETADATARSLLNEHLPALERQLSQSGIQVQRFEVHQTTPQDTANGNQQQQTGQQPGNDNAGQQQGQQRSPNWRTGETLTKEKDDTPLNMADLLAMAPGMDRLI